MAESVVVADKVELVANNIQNKVGATLLGTKAMAADTVKRANPTVDVLNKIKELNFKTGEKLALIWEVLKSTLDLEKDADRRKREEAKELALEAQKKKKKGAGGLEKVVEEKQNFGLRNMMATVGTTLLTIGGLKAFTGAIFRGGLWALLGAMAGKAIISLLDISSPSAVDAIKTTLPTAAAMLAMFKLKTALLVALPVISAFGIASIASWLTGKKAAEEVTGFDWGSAALTGPALALFLRFGLGMKGGATLFGLISVWPLVIASSLAIALGVGVSYLANKVDKIQNTMLDSLKETTEMTQKDFETRLANDRQNAIAKHALWLAALMDDKNLNMVQQNIMALKAAKKGVKDGEFKTPEIKDNVMEIIDMYAKLSEKGIDNLLKDKHRVDDVNDLKIEVLNIAKTGAFGEDENAVMMKMANLEEKMQEGAERRIDLLTSKGMDVPSYVHQVSDATSQGTFGKKSNLFEKYMRLLEPEQRARAEHIEKLENDPEYLALKKKWESPDRMSALPGEGMSADEEKKYFELKKIIADAYLSQNSGRNVDMNLAAVMNTVGMLEHLMSLDTSHRIDLNKIVNRSQLKKDPEKVVPFPNFIDNKKTSIKADRTSVGITSNRGYNSLGTEEEKQSAMYNLNWYGASSDIKLKENIKFEGKSPSDINIYSFKYKDKEGRYKGVMAQEVPWASFFDNNGYLMVDYSKLDVDFVKI